MGQLYLVMSIILSAMAGFVNIAMVLTFANSIAHHTGSLTRSIVSIVEGNIQEGQLLFMLIGVFMFGGIISGMVFPYRDAVNRYGKMLIALGVVYVALAMWHATSQRLLWYGVFMLGVQNGFCLPYRGLVVRTTHFTGYMTDAGVEFGRLLVGKSTGVWKIGFFMSGIVAFGLGAVASGFVTRWAGNAVFFIIGGLYITIGTMYMCYVQKYQDILLAEVCQKCGEIHK